MENITNKSEDISAETLTKLSGTEGIPKFTQTCRVCLCETNESDQQLDTRILLLNNAQAIRSLLEESTGVQIVNLDFLPNHICDRCFKTLTACYRFRSQTQRSNEILKKYLKNLSTSLDTKSLPCTDLTIHMQGDKMNVLSSENVSQIQDFQVSFVRDKPEIVGFVFHCDSCTMTFKNHVGLDKHQEEHSKPTKQNSFKCKHCPKSFAFRNGMDNHMKLSHHQWQRHKFQCDVCERQYNSATNFKRHTSKPCVPVDLIEQCKTQKLDVRKEDLVAVAEKTIRETKISCILCKKNFKSHEDFIGHYPKHGKERKCSICHKDFKRFKFLERHVRMHLRAKVYACPICSRSFYTCQAFRAHMKEHGKREWVYRCNLCQKEFFIVREFDTHMVKHLEAKQDEKKALEKAKHNDVEDILEIENTNDIEINNECDSNISAESHTKNDLNSQMGTNIPHCQAPFRFVKEEDDDGNTPDKPERDTFFKIDKIESRKQLQLIKTEGVVDSSYKLEAEISIDDEGSYQSCQLQDDDNDQFNTNAPEVKTEISVLKDIVKLENPELDNPSSEEENAEETDDDTSSLSKSNDQLSENQLSEYTKNLLDECKVNCHVAGCKTKCTNLAKIWRHFKKEHLSGEKPFKCSICLEQFDHMKSFQLHIKKYYSFKCPVCSKLKTNSCELKRHVILTHSNERPFKCSKCPKRFGNLTYLKGHEITHNSQKEYVCSICSKDFFSSSGLKMHSKSHKDIKELQCSHCNRQFLSKYHLKRHINIKSCVRNQKK